MKRLSNPGVQRSGAGAARKIGGALVELDDRALDLALVHLRQRNARKKEKREKPLHDAYLTSASLASRMERAKSSTARASATRCSPVCMMVLAAITWMPSERIAAAKATSSWSMTKPSMKFRYSVATARAEGSLPSSRIILPAEPRSALPPTIGDTAITG